MAYNNVDDLIEDLLVLQAGLKPSIDDLPQGKIVLYSGPKFYFIYPGTKIGKYKGMLKIKDDMYYDWFDLINIYSISAIELRRFHSEPICEDWEYIKKIGDVE